MRDLIENDIAIDDSGVWVLAEHKNFSYTEGPSSERYLDKALLSSRDLTSDSYELEGWIRDWPSEYHLSRKRSQLLRGFQFDPSKKVLEVGCGCGAITRFLGETFYSVVAIEGSLERARLARLRTRDLDNVSILCAPFQTMKFKEPFDIIFCIGVLEYSNMFVDSPNPFDFILRYFRDLLTPDGIVFIAIENQFGLKYFSSSREDHTDIMFDGLEGYPRTPRKERTFGYYELKTILAPHFKSIEFYFPYPDYKTPSCILSERFFQRVKAGELLGNFHSRLRSDNPKHFFDERLVLLELEKNGMLPFFSNSFLLIAGGEDHIPVTLGCLGVTFSRDRVGRFQTVTRITERKDGGVYVVKRALCGDKVESDGITLHSVQSKWIDGPSIHGQIIRRAKERHAELKEVFAPCKIWLDKLKSLGTRENGTYIIDGKYIDCIWVNSYLQDRDCIFIDREWEWNDKIDINLLVIRSIYELINEMSSMNDVNPKFKMNSRKRLIKDIAKYLGIGVQNRDFKNFCKVEARFAHVISGKSYIHCRIHIGLRLWNKFIFSSLTFHAGILRKLSSKIHSIAIKWGLA
jgi:SAM-dependent methyltransferase